MYSDSQSYTLKGMDISVFVHLMHSEGGNIQLLRSDKNTNHRAPHASINVSV